MSFIVVEGIDGSGKSTLLDSISQFMEKNKISFDKLYEPTSGKWGSKIRDLLKGASLPDSKELLDLFIKDREYDVEKNINPAKKNDRVILMDRYYYSNVAYQGAMGIDPESILQMNLDMSFPKPDRVYLLDIDPEIALNRVLGREQNSNISRECFEKVDFLKKVRDIYLSLVDDSFLLVDASKGVDHVANIVKSDIERLLNTE